MSNDLVLGRAVRASQRRRSWRTPTSASFSAGQRALSRSRAAGMRAAAIAMSSAALLGHHAARRTCRTAPRGRRGSAASARSRSRPVVDRLAAPLDEAVGVRGGAVEPVGNGCTRSGSWRAATRRARALPAAAGTPRSPSGGDDERRRMPRVDELERLRAGVDHDVGERGHRGRAELPHQAVHTLDVAAAALAVGRVRAQGRAQLRHHGRGLERRGRRRRRRTRRCARRGA